MPPPKPTPLRAAFGLTSLLLAGCVTTGEPQRVGGTVVDGAVLRGAQVDTGPIPWRLGEQPRLTGGRQDPQDPMGETKEQRDARLRLEFGSNVLIGADGRVTKQYFLAGDLSTTFLKLINPITSGQPLSADRNQIPVPAPGLVVGGNGTRSVLGQMLREHEVEVTYVPDFEVLNGAPLIDNKGTSTVTGAPPPDNFAKAPSVALALVTGEPAAMVAFEDSLDLFYSSIPQVEITVTVVEYNTADALSFGVSSIDPLNNTPLLANLTSNQLVRSYSSAFEARQPIVGTSPVANIGRFALGGIHDAWELNAVIEMLEANNLADISSAPKLVVRNGGVAAISTLTDFPFPKARIQQLGTEVATDVSFKPVGVVMNIIPVIAGTDSIILQVYADVSAVTGFAATDPIDTPITSQRTAITTVYLKNGHTLVIGGLESKTLFESETKVPILGDIPILGFLFRSTSTTKTKTTVEFHITPRIVRDRGSRTSFDSEF